MASKAALWRCERGRPAGAEVTDAGGRPAARAPAAAATAAAAGVGSERLPPLRDADPAPEGGAAYVAPTTADADAETKLRKYLDLDALSANPGGLHILHSLCPQLIQWEAVHDNPAPGALQLLLEHQNQKLQTTDDADFKLDYHRLARHPHAHQLFLDMTPDARKPYLRALCANPHPRVFAEILLLEANADGGADADAVLDFYALSANANPRVLEFLFWQRPHKIDFAGLAKNTNPLALQLLFHHPTLFASSLAANESVSSASSSLKYKLDVAEDDD